MRIIKFIINLYWQIYFKIFNIYGYAYNCGNDPWWYPNFYPDIAWYNERHWLHGKAEVEHGFDVCCIIKYLPSSNTSSPKYKKVNDRRIKLLTINGIKEFAYTKYSKFGGCYIYYPNEFSYESLREVSELNR